VHSSQVDTNTHIYLYVYIDIRIYTGDLFYIIEEGIIKCSQVHRYLDTFTHIYLYVYLNRWFILYYWGEYNKMHSSHPYYTLIIPLLHPYYTRIIPLLHPYYTLIIIYIGDSFYIIEKGIIKCTQVFI
jgi:hypothetical protein